MTPEALQDLSLKLAAVADLLDQRSGLAVQTAEQGAQQLRSTADTLARQHQQMTEQALAAIGGQARQSIERGAGEALDQLRQQLRQASESAGQSARTIAEQAQALREAQRGLVWKAGFALLAGALLAAGGSAFIVWRSLQQLERADFAEDVLEATRSGAITRCADALCVRVGETPKKYGAKGEYVLLEP